MKCLTRWISIMALAFFAAGIFAQAEKTSAAEQVAKAIEESGLASAKDEIMWILQNRDRYSFDEKEFTALGNEYLKAGKPHLAATIFEVAVEAFPGSVSALGLLAHSRYLSGDEADSLEVQARMMAVRGDAELAEFLGQCRDSLAKTAEEVIARSIEATGGGEAWEAVKTMVVVFSGQSTSGMQRKMIRMYKRPLLYRQGLEGSDSFTSTDGITCWNVSGGEWKEIDNFHLPLASMNLWLLGYEAFGISYRFMGFDYLNGSPVYHLRRTYRNGRVEDLYFSAVTNLLTEIRSDYVQHRPFMKSFQSFWNYRDVNGVKIPFVFIRNLGSLEPPHGGVVEEVRVNVPLDDILFLPPDLIK
ncbi:MAG: tetratricopeptide repeat protein [Acidobacteria bacterium]|nr:tetratricopeptide repeat protein [Acidobacteriota bacterium]